MFSSLHDRKMCVLGLCALIDTPTGRHDAINQQSASIVPALLLLFNGLKRAYVSRADDGDSDSEEEDGEDYEEGKLLFYCSFIHYVISGTDRHPEMS